jgi:hypothetical protein
MASFKTYISFVVQNGEQHIHDFAIAELALPKFNLYSDYTSQEVLKWADQRQGDLKPGQKLIILNYFNISNIK